MRHGLFDRNLTSIPNPPMPSGHRRLSDWGMSGWGCGRACAWAVGELVTLVKFPGMLAVKNAPFLATSKFFKKRELPPPLAAN